MPERQNSSSQLLTPSPADGDPLSLSPGGPSLTRRISASALDVTAAGIFDAIPRRPSLSPATTSPAIASPIVASPSAPVSAKTSPTKSHAALTPRPKRPSLDPDLLGIDSSGGRAPSSRRVSSGKKPKTALGIKGLDVNDDVLEARYDEMTDTELQAILDRWTVKPLDLNGNSRAPSNGNDDDQSVSADNECDPHATPCRGKRPTSKEAPQLQQQQDASSRLALRLSRSSSAQPLFPPSPPQAPESSEHPLRVLSKAVRGLMASVSRLEAENEALRDTIAEQATQISRLAQAAAPGQAMASRPVSIARDGGETGSLEEISVPKGDQVSSDLCF